jgi:DNA mismatch endonuclease (patch repair protein)
MRRNTASGGTAETLLRHELRRRGLRLQSNVTWLPGKPDLVIASARLCVFCDGDFWHGRRWRVQKRLLAERANSEYWIEKITSNRLRDREQTRQLRKMGWRVLRAWETDILKNPDRVVGRILRALA